MYWLGAQRSETFDGGMKCKRRYTTPLKANSSKTSLRKLLNSHQSAKFSTTLAFRNILQYF